MSSALHKRSALSSMCVRVCNRYKCVCVLWVWCEGNEAGKVESANGPDWNCLGLIKRDMCGIACICAATATATATPTATATIGGGTRLQVWIEWRSERSVRGECANQCSIIDKLPDASVHYAGIASVDAFMKFMRCTRRRSLIYEPDQRETERRRGGGERVPLQPVECGICIYLHRNRWINKILGITICCDFILCRAQLNPKGITKYAGTFRECRLYAVGRSACAG